MNRYLFGLSLMLAPIALLGFSPAVATAQSQVKGSGTIKILHGAVDGANLFVHVAVNAWLDEYGIAQGQMTWQGDVEQLLPGGTTEDPGGPAEPYQIDVTGILFSPFGNIAVVFGVVTSSPGGVDVGVPVAFIFTDNGSTGYPDALNHQPLDAGNYIVR